MNNMMEYLSNNVKFIYVYELRDISSRDFEGNVQHQQFTGLLSLHVYMHGTVCLKLYHATFTEPSAHSDHGGPIAATSYEWFPRSKG